MPCYLDPCVAPGTYEYGYQIPAFTGCNGACTGPTSGEWAVVVTVASPPAGCEAGASIGAPAIWTQVDAAIEDGGLRWVGTCSDSPGVGASCTGYAADGAQVPVSCPGPVDGGGSSRTGAPDGGETMGSNRAIDGSADAPGSGNGGSGCSTTPAGRCASFTPLVAVSLVAGISPSPAQEALLGGQAQAKVVTPNRPRRLAWMGIGRVRPDPRLSWWCKGTIIHP